LHCKVSPNYRAKLEATSTILREEVLSPIEMDTPDRTKSETLHRNFNGTATRDARGTSSRARTSTYFHIFQLLAMKALSRFPNRFCNLHHRVCSMSANQFPAPSSSEDHSLRGTDLSDTLYMNRDWGESRIWNLILVYQETRRAFHSRNDSPF